VRFEHFHRCPATLHRRSLLVFVGVLLSIAFSGCAGDTNVAKVDTQRVGSMKGGEDDGRGLDGDESTPELPQGDLIDATYDIEIKGIFGAIKVCEGEVQLKFNTMGQFQLPKGDVACLFGLIKVDLASMLKGLATNPNAPGGGPAPMPELVADDKVIRIGEVAGAKFTPPRPMLVSVFKATPQELSGYSVSDEIIATDTKSGQSARGTVGLSVTGVNDTVHSEHFSKPFDKIVRWELTATGFSGLNKPMMFLFDKVEIAMNLDPIAIPELSLEGKMNDFMKATDGAPGGGANPLAGVLGGGGGPLGGITSGPFAQIAMAIAGKVVVNMTLKDMAGVDK